MSETEAEPRTEGGFRYADRRLVLCRTCLRPLTWETRTEPGYKPREGWYDDARIDPLICFKAVDYRHVPLTDREWAYYEAGYREALAAANAAWDDGAASAGAMVGTLWAQPGTAPRAALHPAPSEQPAQGDGGKGA